MHVPAHLLTPLGTKAMESELAHQAELGRYDHRAEVLADGTHVLVTAIDVHVHDQPQEDHDHHHHHAPPLRLDRHPG